MSARNSLLKKIQEARVKSESEKKFSGTLMDYADLVEKDPTIVKTSHQRLYEAITEHGSTVMPDSDSRKFNIFESYKTSLMKARVLLTPSKRSGTGTGKALRKHSSTCFLMSLASCSISHNPNCLNASALWSCSELCFNG